MVYGMMQVAYSASAAQKLLSQEASWKRFWGSGSTVSVKFPIQEVGRSTATVVLQQRDKERSNRTEIGSAE